MGKKGQKQKKYSEEFMIDDITHMRTPFRVSRNRVKAQNRWGFSRFSNEQNTFLETHNLEEGAKGLMKELRGAACKESGTCKEHPPNLEKKVEED